MSSEETFYVTTPIYYVNDRPHIGHVYSTTVADILARFHRLDGREVFFLTGTDEHATKVVDAAAERDLSPQAWADQNAEAFEQTFKRLGLTHDDFIRTSESRHMERVGRYVQELLDAGEIYEGDYEGWYDAGQEEYIPENKAKELDYTSPFNGKPLVRKQEKNYFFRLSEYADDLLALYENDPGFVKPDARRNEVSARVREGLNDVPISRRVTDESASWGIRVPGDDEHVIYVWIDALFNYLSTIDTDERRHLWPANVHVIAKDILWFHAVIWPAILLALGKRPDYQWLGRPERVYAHSFWIAEGRKMSKSLGNFIDLEKIDEYVATFGLDALRWFLARNGPLGTTDSDFAESLFVETYNNELANTIGNCLNRVCNMTSRYFDGELPAPDGDVPEADQLAKSIDGRIKTYRDAMDRQALHQANEVAVELVRDVNGFIDVTEPFRRIKDESRRDEVATILYACAEAMRIASLLLWPTMPERAAEALGRLGRQAWADQLADRGRGELGDWL
ncbi:MAG: methionine--tRNA ligase, partial [Phycisphaeraceae bacterium]|nr:methionine--tRNA ligase [Phycisphaeraceae bacterium]